MKTTLKGQLFQWPTARFKPSNPLTVTLSSGDYKVPLRGTFKLEAIHKIKLMIEGSERLPAPDGRTDSYGMELAMRLAENAHDKNQPRTTYEIFVHGQQWTVDVWKRVAVIE